MLAQSRTDNQQGLYTTWLWAQEAHSKWKIHDPHCYLQVAQAVAVIGGHPVQGLPILLATTPALTHASTTLSGQSPACWCQMARCMHVSVCFPACLFVCPFAGLSVCLCLSVCLSVCPPVCLLSVYLSVSVCMLVLLSVCVFLCACCLSDCMLVCLRLALALTHCFDHRYLILPHEAMQQHMLIDNITC